MERGREKEKEFFLKTCYNPSQEYQSILMKIHQSSPPKKKTKQNKNAKKKVKKKV
jgi:hypothetical protein